MLYIVATPIGNLDDMSIRAIETLKSVDVIACEDTRNSKKLLSHFEIDKPLIAYHKFNERTSAEGIIKLLDEKKDVALISDSGTPLISDPGNILTKTLRERGYDYTVVPGANAALCALILSGLDTSRFTFVGFLPEKQSQKEELLSSLCDREETLVFHVSCHNIKDDLNIIFKMLGPRPACLVKEITKLHENAVNFTLGEDVEIDERGEFILVVEKLNKNNEKIIKNNSDNSQKLINEVNNFINLGLKKNEAIKLVARINKEDKDKIYKLFFN